jgi:regulator of sirC expression with transglutaminase-like and TPR domain
VTAGEGAASETRARARAFLESLGALPDERIDIAEAALAFARIDLPLEDPEPARRHLRALAEEAARLTSGEAEESARSLGELLALRHGYRGDSETYDDPANANLLRVIARRRGLPVALGILWLHAAKAAGIEAWGIDFPGHFLVGVAGARVQARTGGAAVAVDVFDGGAVRTRDELAALLARFAGPAVMLGPEHLRAMSTRQVLLRLQNNLRLRRAAAGDLEGALVAAEDMLRLAPAAGPLWREAAVLAERLGRPRAALAAWERAAALTGADEAVAALARLRRQLH